MNTLMTHLSLAVIVSLTSFATASGEAKTTSITIPVGEYDVVQTGKGHELFVEGYGRHLVPGMPDLPSRIFPIAIPPGRVVDDISYDFGKGIELPGIYDIIHVPLPLVIGQEDPAQHAARVAEYEMNYALIYGRDDAYPAGVGELVRTAHYRKYNIVDVRINPIIYNPLSGRLTYYPDITVHIHHNPLGKNSSTINDNLERCETIAGDLILNYRQIQFHYQHNSDATRGLYDFVIVTLDSLTGSVTPLAAWETAKGRTVNVVTTTWINSNYTGYDLAEKIRNFLREKYPSGEWGIEDVLLVGHYDDVPMRRTEQDTGYGKPETDFYYAELSLPDSESWDADGDHRWGENSDPIDFYAEVNVGRIPWSDPATVQHICNKSIAFEQNGDPAFKKNILLLGAFFWPDTDNAVLMETKIDQTWMNDWTTTRMYEQGYSTYPMDYNLNWNNVKNVWSAGTYSFVNWAGHGSPTSSHIYYSSGGAFVSNDTCQYLNDEYPSIIFADACSNSDTDHLNIGQAMLRQGGVGFLGATKVAYGKHAWNDPYDGSSQSLDYFFTAYVTSGDYTQGQAHQKALLDMYVNGLWYYNKYETFEWGALWGNPDLAMGTMSALNIMFPNGLPEFIPPGVETSITVRIQDGSETYVPGTGTFYYRYDGGTYITSPLVELGDDLYEATLPAASCDDAPEFYFSAQGDGSTVVFNPYNAPDTVYTATIGTNTVVYENNFDNDPGWTMESQWAYGQPTGGGGENGGPDPTSGYTGPNVLGYNLNGDYANNLPERHLTSNPIDCSGLEEVHLKFWRWLGVEQPIYDHAYVRVSNNGTNWTTVWENSGGIEDSSWVEMDIDISAVADNQSDVYLRWTMGTTDSGWRYCGWNIDDVQLTAFVCDEPPCPADLTGDNQVNIDDIFAVLGLWGDCPDPCPPFCTGDLTEDCTVNIDDIFAILGQWGPCD